MVKTINKETFNSIYKDIEKYKERFGFIDVDVEDILYTYFNSTDKEVHLLNDWEEEDKKEVNFILEYCKKLNNG